MTRKEQKEERRKNILMCALSLFVDKGYHDTKISDIAKAASMSTGLMFHYFASKEELLLELVRLGLQGPAAASEGSDLEVPPDVFLTGFLKEMFSYAKEQPWVFQMFVLMAQVRKAGMPEEARRLAMSSDTMQKTALMIQKGQTAGIFRKGDPGLLSKCFWASVQGIMEEMASDPCMEAPDPAWIVAILKNG